MTVYNGKNKIKSSIELAFERSKFRSERMADDPEEKVMKDFTLYENHHYGRIDELMNVIFLDKQNLKTIKSKDNNVSALNFVTDAFEKVQSRFKMALSVGNIPSTMKYLSAPKAHKGYEDPEVLYAEYIKSYFENFNNVFLKNQKILSFDEYYNKFYEYIQTMNIEYPITFTGFQRSKYSNIFTTGLAISIADLSIDEDQLKEDFFMDTSCFEFYKKVCLNNGFYISKNSPWILVANILSPSLLIYTKKYKLSTKKQIFFSNFNNCIKLDLNLMINNLLIYYNKFYNNKLYYKDIDICNNKIKSNIIYKNPINIEKIDKKYTEDYLFDLYITARNIEEYSPYNPSQLKQIIKNAKNFYNLLDNSEAIGYINNTFRKTYTNRHGGLNDIVRRLDRRESDFSNT